jgi:hypothetical protein
VNLVGCQYEVRPARLRPIESSSGNYAAEISDSISWIRNLRYAHPVFLCRPAMRLGVLRSKRICIRSPDVPPKLALVLCESAKQRFGGGAERLGEHL